MADPSVAVVSGAAGGIGRALAEGFLRAGYEVTGVDRAPEGWTAPGFRYVPLDITDGAAVAGFGAGLERLAVLVNAAGIIRRVEEFEIETFEQVLDVNLTGTMRLSTACRPALAKRGGAIINIASMLSFFGGGLVPAYSASKGGIVTLTKSLAIAWAKDNIRVNAIAPGWIMTQRQVDLWLNPESEGELMQRQCLKRKLQPDEIARFTVFMASEEASACTNQHYVVDGGWV
jgi:NAD(P)-dependent dehydrogenase (short-subunit alcohol dehydrogenase family)